MMRLPKFNQSIFPLTQVFQYISVSSQVKKPQDCNAQAAVLQLCLRLAQGRQSVVRGSSLDRAVLSVSLFRQAQLSPCQCHPMFVAEGNPTAGLQLLHVFSPSTARTFVRGGQKTLLSISHYTFSNLCEGTHLCFFCLNSFWFVSFLSTKIRGLFRP